VSGTKNAKNRTKHTKSDTWMLQAESILTQRNWKVSRLEGESWKTSMV